MNVNDVIKLRTDYIQSTKTLTNHRADCELNFFCHLRRTTKKNICTFNLSQYLVNKPYQYIQLTGFENISAFYNTNISIDLLNCTNTE